MKAGKAGILFLIGSLIIAILLLTKVISSTTSGIVFAILLILFGLRSKGFANK